VTASLPLLSNSEKRCFQSCKRKHYLRYRLLKRPLRSSDPQRFGTTIHHGLEAWWRAAMTGTEGDDRLMAALNAMRADLLDPFDLAKAEELMIGYHLRWLDDVVEVLGVEVEFRAPIVNPRTGVQSRTFMLGGKIDAIARLADGNVYLIEHKTTSEDIEGGSDYWQRLRLDSQVSDYFVGARALGFEVVGCLYDVIGKPKLQRLEATPIAERQYRKDGQLYARQREHAETIDEYRLRLRAHIAENIDRYYKRGEVVRTAEDEREAALDTWDTARDLRDAERFERYPRNTNACKSWGQKCEFWAVCAGEGDVDDPTLYRTANRPHEELALPAEAVDAA
jgi:hypothetical protein